MSVTLIRIRIRLSQAATACDSCTFEWVIETRIISEITRSSSFQSGCGAIMIVKTHGRFGTVIAVCDSAHMSCGVLFDIGQGIGQGIGGAAK
jgi:hypothetical protein